MLSDVSYFFKLAVFTDYQGQELGFERTVDAELAEVLERCQLAEKVHWDHERLVLADQLEHFKHFLLDQLGDLGQQLPVCCLAPWYDLLKLVEIRDARSQFLDVLQVNLVPLHV